MTAQGGIEQGDPQGQQFSSYRALLLIISHDGGRIPVVHEKLIPPHMENSVISSYSYVSTLLRCPKTGINPGSFVAQKAQKPNKLHILQVDGLHIFVLCDLPTVPAV